MAINNITFKQDYPVACNNVTSRTAFAGKIKENAPDEFINSSSPPATKNNSGNKNTMNCLVGGILVLMGTPVTSLVGGILLGWGLVDALVGRPKGPIL